MYGAFEQLDGWSFDDLVHSQCMFLTVCSVEWLVLDESDKLFEDGTLGFRDQVSMFLPIQARECVNAVVCSNV